MHANSYYVRAETDYRAEQIRRTFPVRRKRRGRWGRRDDDDR